MSLFWLHAAGVEAEEFEGAPLERQAELAARSETLTEREAALVIRERAVAAKETPPTPELDELEARIRRLEQRSQVDLGATQTFSSGLRALEQRGVRRGDSRNEPLH